MTTKRLTAEDLSVIEVRANAATGGEWVAYEPTEFRGDIRIAKAFDEYPDGRQKNTYVGRLVESHVGHEKPRREDGEFIAAARTDVPDLIAEVRRLTAELSYAGRPRYSGDASVAVEAIDAAFTRGVEAMREAATKACARVEDEAELSSEGDVAMRCANRIRSLKVSP